MRQGHHLLIAAALAAALLAGCGDDEGGGEGNASRPAPDPAEFPAADGRSLGEVLSEGTQGDLVVQPAGGVLRVGENRYGVGVFTTARDQVTDAEMAIYAAPGNDLKGPAIGPFTTRVEDLTTESAFTARTTSEDPDAAKVVYVTDIPLDKPGPWTFGALVKDGAGFTTSLIPAPYPVGQFDREIPAVGDPAPKISTPTADEVADISEIDTRTPPSTQHEEDLADVLGKKPAVLLFATPSLCQSRVCGPVVDVAEQVKRDYGDRVAFIHQEVFVDNDLSKGTRPQLKAYNLPSEPWLFVIDGRGKVSTVIEGAYSVDELEAAVQKVLG
jgi:hypothetical protein